MPSTTGQVGIVALLARYPVKSMRGEQLASAEIEQRGMVGDRQWAVYTPDGGIGSGKSSRRFRRIDGLLGFRATLTEPAERDGSAEASGSAEAGQPAEQSGPAEASGSAPLIESPSGQRFRADDPRAAELLSAELGRPVRLGREAGVRHHDESGLHLVTNATLGKLSELLGGPVDAARFRSNLLLDVPGAGFVEDAWVGRQLRLGSEVVLRLGPGMPRCVMVDLPQGSHGPDGRILKLLAAEHQLLLGLQVEVVRGGRVRLGDPAVLE